MLMLMLGLACSPAAMMMARTGNDPAPASPTPDLCDEIFYEDIN
jgi:hypothetical protein